MFGEDQKSRTREQATKRRESRSPGHRDPPLKRGPRKGNPSQGTALSIEASPNTSSTKHMNASTMKLVPPDTRLKDYKKRRSAFLQELIASTPNVSVRAKEFRRWIDENSPYGDNNDEV